VANGISADRHLAADLEEIMQQLGYRPADPPGRLDSRTLRQMTHWEAARNPTECHKPIGPRVRLGPWPVASGWSVEGSR
jgi:hypothetical protein